MPSAAQLRAGFFENSVLSVAFIICMYYFDLYDSSILSNSARSSVA